MLCPLSALDPLGGPQCLLMSENIDPLSAEMATEIISYGEVSLSLQDVVSIVASALRLTLPPPENSDMYDFAPKLPDRISDWEHCQPIGIGYFDKEEYIPVQVEGRHRSGRDIEVRRLDQFDGYGYFYAIIVEDDVGGERSEGIYVVCRGERGWNFFVLHGCLEYLRVWLDPNLPPRIAFKGSEPSMNLEGELYEILSSRHEERDYKGLFPSFEYGDIPKTFYHDQFFFWKARKGSRHTSRAISAGFREAELLPALYADFQCWLSMRPDVWPPPTAESSCMPIFTPFPTSFSSGNPFEALPTELFLEILGQLPIPAILTLSSASQSLRGVITEPVFLNQVIKSAVLSGTEFWVLPVASLPGEKERAWDVASKWITADIPTSSFTSMLSSVKNVDSSNLLTVKSPFLLPSFPYVQFLRACYASDSMRNRQRLWRIVKQFDVLWRDYRLNGWQRDDVFAH